MMSSKVKVGLVSTSWWADMFHLPTLKSHPQAELVSICGRNLERAQEMAEKYAVSRVFADYEEMISHSDLDAVVIASPDDQHFPMTMAALEAGLHVFCEKPLALNLDDAKKMRDKAKSTGLVNGVVFTNRWALKYRYLHDLVHQGYLGKMYHSEFHYQFGYARGQNYLWRYDQDRANGVLGDLGVHMIDLALWMLGDIASVSANLAVCVERESTPNPANDSAMCLVEYVDGSHGLIRTSAVNHQGNGITIKLYGENGTLEVADEILGAQKDEEPLQKIDIPEHYFEGIDSEERDQVFLRQSAGPRAFIDAILSGHPMEPDFTDGYKAQQVVQAALDSHRTGRRIEITMDR